MEKEQRRLLALLQNRFKSVFWHPGDDDEGSIDATTVGDFPDVCLEVNVRDRKVIGYVDTGHFELYETDIELIERCEVAFARYAEVLENTAAVVRAMVRVAEVADA